MFKDKIWVEKGFQTSINIGYDLHNENKIKSFIPTTASIDIIEDILLSTNDNSTSRAQILIGAYGKGKSHIILVLMSLFLKKEKSLFDALLNKIREYNVQLYNYTLNYIESDKKLLPVIISGSNVSLTQSFLGALQQSLKNENLLNLMPETNFEAIITTIELWRDTYPETYERFGKLIDISIDEFIVSLHEFNISSYDKFNEVFPKITSGSAFNPFANVDVVELYSSIADKIKDYGFDGIYIIYDEFSKYLESSIANATISDIKLLQDFAEKCDRSGAKQMHLMLISHKDISNYIDKNLQKEKVDGWRGVSGRFKHINIHNNFSQMYEIIAAVIKKDPDFWNDYIAENGKRFESITRRFSNNGLLDKDDLNNESLAIKGCYPLHPISTFILPRLSEKVAQNERTLFTFLSSDDKYTLTRFLDDENGEFPILTPEYIYDYFEPLFRKEIYTSNIHKIYSLTSNVLKKLKNGCLGCKIIKTISLIYMVEQFEKLPPTSNTIVDTFADTVADIEEINNVLKELIEDECIVYLKRSNGYLKIKESSGVNIVEEIKKCIDKTSTVISVKDILNKASFDNYMYPIAYNDEMEITRYFDFNFIDSDEFYKVDNWERKIENLNSDGVVYAIIPQKSSDIEKIKKIVSSKGHGHRRILFVLPRVFTDISIRAYEYYAVKLLKKDIIEDDLLADEYDILIEDLEDVIRRFISSYTRPEIGETEYFYCGKRMEFKRKTQLSTQLSQICFETYLNTPIINNESINKDIITTSALNNRNKVVSGLLETNLAINLGLSGNGQDVSFMRSTLIRKGVLLNEEISPELTLAPTDDKLHEVLFVIQSFFTEASTKEGKNFKELYDVLILPRNGYGIKKGVIPIYIAVVLHSFKKYMVIKTKNNEVNISADLLNSINENPENFIAYMEDWNDEKTQYIKLLSELFKEHIIEREKDYNTFSYIVSAMSRWYMSLPKYAKSLKTIYKGKISKSDDKLNKSEVKFINSLKSSNINAREYLFNDIFKIFDYVDFNINIVDDIRRAKEMFDNAKASLISHLISDVKLIYSNYDNECASLSSVIKDYIEALRPQTLNHLYTNGEDRILSLMKSIDNDDILFIETLGKAVAELRIDDWTSEVIVRFIDDLEKAKKSIGEYDCNSAISDINMDNSKRGYKICFIDEDDNEIIKTFNKAECSNRAKLLYNEISVALNEMGQSISDAEKRQVLMSFIEKMC